MVALVLLAGCTGEQESSRDPGTAVRDINATDVAVLEEGGTLAIGVDGLPINFNPWHIDALNSTVDRVLEPTRGSAIAITDDGQWQIDPLYAESVDVTSTDPLTVQVSLNPEAVWQDGTPITGADMSAFVGALRNDEMSSASHPAYTLIESVDVESEFVYSVVFSSVTAEWPAAVYPGLPSSISEDPEAFNSGFVETSVPSNGPFVVSAIDRSTGTVTMERNRQWWGPTAVLDEVVWRDATAQVQSEAIAQDTIDVATVEPATRDSIPESMELREASSRDWVQVTINSARPALQDENVRQAITLAIDRGALAADVADRTRFDVSITDSYVYLPDQAGYTEGALEHSFDRAREVLAEAGFAPGADGVLERGSERLAFTMPVIEDNLEAQRRGELIADHLAAVGIDLTVVPTPFETFYTNVVIALGFDMVTFAWQGSPFGLSDARALFAPVDSNRNFTGVSNPGIAADFDTAIATLDDTERYELVASIDARLREQASVIPIAALPEVLAVDPRVANYGPVTFGNIDWTEVGYVAEQ